ncbi:hypothetical protein Bca101_009792 [Brassica carinata]
MNRSFSSASRYIEVYKGTTTMEFQEIDSNCCEESLCGSSIRIVGFAAVPTQKARSTVKFTSLTLQKEGAMLRKIHDNFSSGNKGAAYSEKGVSLASVYSNGWTTLMVAGSWHRNWLEEILNPTTDLPQGHPLKVPYPFICLHCMWLARN